MFSGRRAASRSLPSNDAQGHLRVLLWPAGASVSDQLDHCRRRRRRVTPAACGHEQTDRERPVRRRGRHESEPSYTGRLPPVQFSHQTHPPTYLVPTADQSHLRPAAHLRGAAAGCSGWVGPVDQPREPHRAGPTEQHEVGCCHTHQLFRTVRRICLFVLLRTV